MFAKHAGHIIMTSSSKWFGKYFSDLHPLLQQLHLNGGVLSGSVEIKFGRGLAHFIGHRIAKKLNIPTEDGKHTLQVTIEHVNDELHWSRCFNSTSTLKSIFIPRGEKSNGYWVEHTGAMKLYLTVNIKDQGWYWQPIGVKIKGISIPMWLFPKTKAYKYIDSGKYRFYVSFSLFMLGTVLSYSGFLSPEVHEK